MTTLQRLVYPIFKTREIKLSLIAMCIACCLTVTSLAIVNAQTDADAADARAEKLAQRFFELLQRKPRFGTSLDRVYGHHVERGTLDEFTRSLNDAVKAKPDDGATWMILGLVEMQRGRDGDAMRAFREAEKHRTDDPLASYYLGKSLVLIGETEQAAAAFERAIARKPQKVDLLEVFQELGRIHQRTHDTEKALAVWDRLEKQFPDDTRVQEQIATILADENDFEAALQRFEALVKKSKDAYRKVQYALKAGDMLIRLGKPEVAIAKFEGQLGELKPDSWLHRDVRRRIEDVFLRSDDYAGLVEYYEAWLKKNPDDIDAMTRVGNSLSFQGRAADARTWYERAVKLAPTNKNLRKALIDQMVREKKFADAIKEYGELDRIDPNNPDYIEQWGLLVLADESKPEPVRKQMASRVWKRLTDAKPKDAIIASQVADLHRSAKLSEEAIALYRKAIDLAPGDVQYREYLGEYYHQLERKDAAIATWKTIADGNQRNTVNLVRLAEVFDSFGYGEQGLEAMTAAIALKPEFSDRVRFAQMLRAADRFDDGLKQLKIADATAESPEEVEVVLDERIKNYQASGQLADRTSALQKELTAGKNATLDRWKQLSLYYEAATRLNEATSAIEKALVLDQKSVPVWTVAARVYEKSGRLGEATSANRKLADLDRRFRTEYLKTIAGLEMRLGRIDESLQAGRDLIAAAPGNPEHYQFFASLCFQLGKPDLGLETLRRSVRVNPSDDQSLMALAGALAEQFKTAEAIELYWRAFDKADDLDSQTSVVTRMTDLYLRTNHFDRLISRLENLGRELNQERDMTLCLASAYQAAGDLGMARNTLESLLSEDSRDIELLKQLSNAAEREDDLENAVKYQRRIAELVADPDATARLASLLARNGDVDEAEQIWMRSVETDREIHRIYDAIDKLISNAKYDAAASLLEKRLRQNPKSWEAVYRQAVVSWKRDKKDEAYQLFANLTQLDIDREATTAKAEYLAAQAKKRASFAASARQVNRYSEYQPKELSRAQAVYQIKNALGISNQRYYSGRANQIWIPTDFGTARVAGLVMLLHQATEKEAADEFMAARAEQAKNSIASKTEPTWDWMFLIQAQAEGQDVSESKEYQQAIDLMARRKDPAANWFILSKLVMRAQQARNAANGNPIELEPLPNEELDKVLEAANAVMATNPAWLLYGNSATALADELTRSGREEEAKALYDKAMESANDDRSLALALRFAATRGDLERVIELDGKIRAKSPGQGNIHGNSAMGNQNFLKIVHTKMQADPQNGWAVAIRLLDVQLTYQREDFEKRKQRRMPRSTSSSNYVYVYDGTNNYNYQQLDYPQPDQYFDQSAIAYLYNTWNMAKKHKTVDETLQWLEQRTETTAGNDQLLSHLALSHVLWWQQDKSGSIQQLAKAVQKAPDNVDMLMRLAETRQQDGDAGQALALIDSIQPTDHNVLREREILALQLAVNLGNIERARKAAGRLFGLRLDANIQIQLAAQMHQLGMHDMAQGVLSRSRRQAGNSSTTLVSLMQQYQSQGNADVASQIANQILRRIPLSKLPQGYRDSNSIAREQAIQTLKRAGELSTLITRVEAQLERSPKSLQLHQLLAEYYKADGQDEKATEILGKISNISPNNPKSLLSLAQQLERAGNLEEATEKYLAAFAKEPSLFSNNYYQIIRTFERAKKLPELAKVFSDSDLKSMRQTHYVTRIVQNLMNDKATRPDGLALLKRLWKLFPDERANMLDSLSSSAWREMPELIEYAREGLIPTSTRTAANGWNVIRVRSWSNDGTGSGVLTYLMKGLDDPKTVESLMKDVEGGLASYKDWRAGHGLLAVLEAKAGKTDEAATRLEKLLSEGDKFPIPTNSTWVIGQELEGKNEALDQLVMKLYEHGLEQFNKASSSSGLGYSPLRKLAGLYKKYDRKQDARRLIYRLVDEADYSRDASNPGYAESQQIDNIIAASNSLTTMGFPVDAVQLLGRIDSNMTDKAVQWNGSYVLEQIKRAKTAAEKAVTPAAVLAALDDWLTAGETLGDQPAETQRDPKQADPKTTPETANSKSKKPQPVIDLMLAVRPKSLDEATVKSMFVDALELAISETGKAKSRANNKGKSTSVGKDKGDTKPSTAEAGVDFKMIDNRLAALFEKYPNDPGVGVAATAFAFMRDDLETARARLAKIDALQQTTKSGNANDDIALWLVARYAIADEQSKVIGERMAQRAMAGANSQSDSYWKMAILRERGEIALKNGDRKAAEAYWSQMLDSVMAQNQPKASSVQDPKGVSGVKSAVDSVLKALRGK